MDGVSYVHYPMIHNPGEPAEQATMFVLDHSGNALEFKSFRNPEHVFTA
jgi:extradiol dioxygenase family protein